MINKNLLITSLPKVVTSSVPPPLEAPDFVVVEMPWDEYEIDADGNLKSNTRTISSGIYYTCQGYIQKYSQTTLPYGLEYFVMHVDEDAETDINGFYYFYSNKPKVYICWGETITAMGAPTWVQALPETREYEATAMANIQDIWVNLYGYDNPREETWYLAYSKD